MSEMDDGRLGELFRTAAASVEAPPAAFDHDDVLAGSRRLARRQRAVVTAAVVAVAGLGGGAGVGGGAGLGTDPASTLASPTIADAPAGARDADGAPPDGAGADGAGTGAGAARPDEARPEAGAGPGADAAKGTGGAAPGSAPGTPPDAVAPRMAPKAAPFAAPPGALAQDADRGRTGFVAGCARPDAEVFAQLSAVLPELRGRTPRPVPGGCAEGGVGVAVDTNGGTLAAVVTPAGVPDTAPADSADRRSVMAEARTGRILRLTVSGSPPPYRDRLPALAAKLAGRL